MPDLLSPTTELDAINSMLSGIGEYPINNIEAELTSAVIARNILKEQTRQLQTKPWHFNTEKNYALPVDVEGKVPVPANLIYMDWKRSYGKDYTVRDGYVYDRINQTFIIGQTLKADLIVLLGFDSLPEPVKSYILIRSTRIFQDRMMGDNALHSYQKEDEQQAWVTLVHYDSDAADYNIFDNDSFREMNDRRL